MFCTPLNSLLLSLVAIGSSLAASERSKVIIQEKSTEGIRFSLAGLRAIDDAQKKRLKSGMPLRWSMLLGSRASSQKKIDAPTEMEFSVRYDLWSERYIAEGAQAVKLAQLKTEEEAITWLQKPGIFEWRVKERPRNQKGENQQSILHVFLWYSKSSAQQLQKVLSWKRLQEVAIRSNDTVGSGGPSVPAGGSRLHAWFQMTWEKIYEHEMDQIQQHESQEGLQEVESEPFYWKDE